MLVVVLVVVVLVVVLVVEGLQSSKLPPKRAISCASCADPVQTFYQT